MTAWVFLHTNSHPVTEALISPAALNMHWDRGADYIGEYQQVSRSARDRRSLAGHNSTSRG